MNSTASGHIPKLYLLLFSIAIAIVTYKVTIYMKLLPWVCLGPRSNPLHFGDDPDYDSDSEAAIRSASRGGGLSSLTGLSCCLLYHIPTLSTTTLLKLKVSATDYDHTKRVHT